MHKPRAEEIGTVASAAALVIAPQFLCDHRWLMMKFVSQISCHAFGEMLQRDCVLWAELQGQPVAEAQEGMEGR